MQRFKILICIAFSLLISAAFNNASASSSIAVVLPKNQDISQVLNQKLNQYDKQRGNLKNKNRNFSLNYSKNYGTMSQSSVVQNPMLEQQNKLNAFKSLNRGPRNSEDFYGFSMRFPLE
jgi:capsular polysaccharide biosynthesis protein